MCTSVRIHPLLTWLRTGSPTFKSNGDTDSAYLVLNAASAGKTRLGAGVTVIVYDKRGGAQLSTFTIESSCSMPVIEGDYFGSTRISRGTR